MKTIMMGIVASLSFLMFAIVVTSSSDGQDDPTLRQQRLPAVKPSMTTKTKTPSNRKNMSANKNINQSNNFQLQNITVKVVGQQAIIGAPNINDILQSSSPQVPPYKGSMLKNKLPVKGETKIFLEHFIASFLLNDPQPPSRIAHFSWIPFTPRLHRIGWHGEITGIQPQLDQSVIVDIKIQPWLFGSSRASVISDFVRERYFVANGQITLLKTDAGSQEGHFHGFTMRNP